MVFVLNCFFYCFECIFLTSYFIFTVYLFFYLFFILYFYILCFCKASRSLADLLHLNVHQLLYFFSALNESISNSVNKVLINFLFIKIAVVSLNTVPSFSEVITQERIPSLSSNYTKPGTKPLQQVLSMHVLLPLTNGHLSHVDRIIWQKGCPY